MVFLEYESLKTRFINAQRLFNDVLLEQERIFSKTQPNAISYDKDNVKSSGCTNKLDEYIIEKEEKQIDEKLNCLRQILEDRQMLLNLKEEELKKSSELYDKIYCYRYLDGLKPHKIAQIYHYSDAQIYRIINKIDNMRENDTK